MLDLRNAGNRFDSPLGNYGVLYFGSDLEACYAETLARFRPDLEVVAEIAEEWDEQHFVKLGGVPADWRQKRVAIRASLRDALPFLDLESPVTIEALRAEMASELLHLGYSDLDISTVLGPDRRVTRWISQWAYDAIDENDDFLFGGIRYMSRIAPEYECWAVFDDAPIEVLEQRAITLDDPELRKIANTFNLTIF